MISYLDGNTSLFPVDVQERYFLRALETEFWRIQDLARKELVESGLYGGEKVEPTDAVAQCAKKAIEERVEFWRAKKNADYFNAVSG